MKIKILYINNEPSGDHSKRDEQSRSYLPEILYKKVILLGLGKYDLLKFYSEYLKFKPDLIVSDWVPAGFVPVFLKKLGLIKCPIVHRWEDYYSESMTNYPKWIVSFMEKFTAKNADYIISVLPTLYKKAKMIRKGRENTVFLLPYGTTPGDKKTKINLNRLKTKKSNVRVIYLGEINNRFKRVDKIIEAAKQTDCDLFLFGEKPQGEFKKIIEKYKNIHYMGWAKNEEVNDILKQGDILVNTANHDISMKFLDYIKARKPILALNDRPRNLFKHKKTAFLTDDFREGLKEIIKDKKLREKIEKNMKSIKIYTWEEVADIHLKLYNKIIENEKNLTEFETNYYHVSY